MYRNIKNFIYLIVLSLILYISGCENNLSDEGIGYISGDTLGTLLLDSQLDTMNITSKNFIKYVNTSSSTNMMVGNYGDYESKSLLRFLSLPAKYDTVSVLSAKLNLRYKKVFYQDSVGSTSFNIYKVNKYYDFTTVTYDKFYNEIGTNILGTYTGTPTTDTVEISIPFDNQTVLDWFKYAKDTNYVNKNYGVIFVPNSSSTTIKSFYNYKNYTSYPGYVPNLTVIVGFPSGGQDTLVFNYSESVSLNYVPQIANLPGRFVIQNGVSIKDILKFDISKLPPKVIINQAALELKIDNANSFHTKGADVRLRFDMLIDTSELTGDGITYYSTQPDSLTYMAYLNIAFQKWNNGTSANLGVLVNNVYDYLNLDRYVFYGPDYPDVSKRPRLKIRYTIRN